MQPDITNTSTANVPLNLMVVGTEGNSGIWSPVFDKWGNLGNVGGWTLKMITKDPAGKVYCVGTEGNVGIWNGSSWENKGNMGGWTLKMLVWDSKGDLWGVGTEGNTGKWDDKNKKWNNLGNLGGWTLKMLAFDTKGTMWGVGTEGNVGTWIDKDNKWNSLGNLGGWTLKMLAFNKEIIKKDDKQTVVETMWCVGTESNVGCWDGVTSWDNRGYIGGWTMNWLYFL
jgi:hypothetical protein